MNAQDWNLFSLSEYFANEDMARELIESIIWSNGPVCPHCDSSNHYELKSKPESKNKVPNGTYKCKDCRKKFNVKIGTIFEKSRIPLNKWLAAIYMMCSSKKGISSLQLSRALKVTQKSAWFMCHRIRFAMDNGAFDGILTGVVEVDETYVGGKPRPENKPRDERTKKNKRGRGTSKQPVMVAVERDGEARAQVIEDVKGRTLKGFVRDNVETSAEIITDEFASYRGLDKEFASHDTVNHGSGEYATGDDFEINTNTAESFFALLKRGL